MGWNGAGRPRFPVMGGEAVPFLRTAFPGVALRPPRWAIAVIAALAACGRGREPVVSGVSAPAEVVGTPFRYTSPYARNVWDMQRFGSRIYLSHGDEIGNRGPAEIWSLDPASGRLARDFVTGDEEIESFRVIDGELYAPGLDPRAGWSMGDFYRLERSGWVRHRTIPRAVHTFDMASHEGTLFAATGGRGWAGEPTLLASDNRGRTWTPAADESQRIYTLFELGDALYAAPKLRTDGDSSRAVLRYDGARFRSTGVTGATLLPGLPDTAGRMLRPTAFRGALVYVVAAGAINWKPAALAVTRDLRDARAVPFPDPAAVPYDLLVRGDTLLALTSAPADSGYVVRVYATVRLDGWRERFRFRSPTFARSFEEVEGDYFIGLGCTYQRPSPASGLILRVRQRSYAP